MLGWVTESVNGIVPLFYDASATTNKLTLLGYLGIFGIAVGIVKLGINFFTGFFVK